MEMRRRAAAGRLAEVFGAQLVPMDVDARTWGHARAAQRDLASLSERERKTLDAYADGVNAFLAERPLPLELRALGAAPEPWTALDALAFGRLMCQGLTVAASHESAVFADARAHGVDAALAFVDAADGIVTEVAPEVREALPQLATTAALVPPVDRDEAPAGSNAWALAGWRTASGKPLLAGDPHLGAERPGTWYAAHLTSADGLDVAGLTLAGLPGIFIGHNAKVAWSVTMNQADDVDLYLERLDASGGALLRGDAWEPLARTAETIRVKGAADVPFEVRAGRHGPIVAELPGGWALSRAWISSDLPLSVGVYLDAARARTGAELLRAWGGHNGPAVNLCWADATGKIGLAALGAIPRRRAGNGRFPSPGWIAAYDWDGAMPAATLPALAEPPSGYVATANDDWSASGVSLPYPGLFASSDRARRAGDLAARLRRAEVADMRAMQADLYSPFAARVVAALATIELADPRAKIARAHLASWDKRADLRGASRLYFEFVRRVRASIPGPSGGGTAGAWVTWSLLDRMIAGTAAESLWPEGRAAGIEAALAGALDAVEREDGRDPARWSWGRVHRLSYPHPLAAGLPAPVARRLSFGPVALPGEWHTLSVAGFRLRGEDYRVVHIPSARLIVDLGDVDASRLVLPLGQSGQILDRRAKNQLRRWSAGRDFAFPFTASAVEADTLSTVRFLPGA
jgi:penicillin amidase